MTVQTLVTKRLLLRPLSLEDVPDITRLIGDFDVSRWLTVVPHPYTLADGETFVRDVAGPWDRAIKIDGQVAGVIGINDGLGYWLGKPYWGHGYMKEAAQALVTAWFNAGNDRLASGYFPENARSGAVLEWLGFVPTGVESVHCTAQARDVDLQKMELSRDAWQARHG